MEDPYTFQSFQCARAPLLGTASSYARHLSEDADSATARPGEGPCRLPEALSGGAAQISNSLSERSMRSIERYLLFGIQGGSRLTWKLSPPGGSAFTSSCTRCTC